MKPPRNFENLKEILSLLLHISVAFIDFFAPDTKSYRPSEHQYHGPEAHNCVFDFCRVSLRKAENKKVSQIQILASVVDKKYTFFVIIMK